MPDAQIIDRLSPRHAVRPRCPRCEARMEVQYVAPGRPGFEHGTLKCTTCGLIHEAQAHADPLKSEALGWFDGELKAPQ
jgi:tRNA(Ile2) C34 agmatinyltransferase TiaS